MNRPLVLVQKENSRTRRAHAIRKDYPGLLEGMKKCQDAINNSLSRAKGFSFDDLKACIVKLVEEREGEEEQERQDKLKRMGNVTSQSGAQDASIQHSSLFPTGHDPKSRPANFAACAEVVNGTDEENREKVEKEDSEDHWDDGRAPGAEDSLLDMDVPEFEGLWSEATESGDADALAKDPSLDDRPPRGAKKFRLFAATRRIINPRRLVES